MEHIDTNKLKAATFIQERMMVKPSNTNVNALNEWINHIRLPEKYVEKFLNEYNKTGTQFNDILEASPNDVEISYGKAEWIDCLTQLINNYNNNSKVVEYIQSKESLNNPYLSFSYSFLNWMLSLIRVKSNHIFDKEVVESSVLESTLKSVLKTATKVLTIEINKLSKENKLNGNTSEERYLDFCKKIEQKEYLIDLLYRYPTMFRIIFEESIQQKNYLLESIDHLTEDYKIIKEKFTISGRLIKIKIELGDSHCRKRTVALYEFEKGIMVYKPKSLDVDQKFNLLIDYLNNKQIKYHIKKLEVIAKKNYGWQPYIEYSGCNNVGEIEQLYYKIGVYACVFHILYGTDFHAENLIVSNANPFFIDLESLFQGFDTQRLEDETAHKQILYDIKDSVIRTSLFPAKINKNSNIDISGITGEGNKIIEKGKFTFENNYTDRIKIVRRPYITNHKKNIPLLNNDRVNPRDYVTFIKEGFTDCYNIISENKVDFIGEKGFVYNFKHCRVRTILRNTKDYNTLLSASTNPKYLSNAAHRNRLFDRMWGILKSHNSLKDVIGAEIKDLLNFDIPYFYSFVDSTSIFDSLENEYKQFHLDTALNKVVKRINIMNEKDKCFQVSMIERVLLTPIKKWELKEFKQDFTLTEHIKIKSKSYLLAEAINLAEEVLELSVSTTEYNDISWRNLTIGYDSQWILNPLDNSMYDGLLGNALFFTSLYKVTNQVRYLEVVERILKSVEMNQKMKENNHTISAFTGDAAVAYCYYYLGIMLNRQDLKEKGIHNILSCINLIQSDNQFDIISGCAGTLIVALRIFQKSSNYEVLSIAIACGEHLINYAIKNDENSVGWKNKISGENILTGMSHGNAGIAWSLLELYKETEILAFRDYALKAIEYERMLYSPIEKNWFDLRNRENRVKKNFPEPVNWCHGAAGIGMARAKCYDLFPDGDMKKEIEVAIDKVLEEGFGGSDCLCHGSMGNMELLLLASKSFHESSYYKMAWEITSDIVVTAKKEQWYCGIPQKSKVPTLMVGLSGIGYQLLRITDPVNVPSILTLELPVERNE